MVTQLSSPVRRATHRGALLVLVFLAGCGGGPGAPAPVREWTIAAELLPDGALSVAETVTVAPDDGAPFVRTLFTPVVPGALLAHAVLEDVAATRSAGGGGTLTRHAWGEDRTTLAYAPSPVPTEPWHLELRYRLRGLVADGAAGGTDELTLDWLGGLQPRAVERLRLELRLPESVPPQEAAVEGYVLGADYEELDPARLERAGRTIAASFEGLPPQASVRWRVTWPGAALSTPGATTWLRDLLRQAAPVPLLAGAFLLVAVVLLFLPPAAAVMVTKLWHGVLALLVVWLHGALLVYWFVGRPDLPSGELLSSALSEAIGALGLVGFVVLFLARQVRDLRPGARAAWGLEAAVPVALLAMAPYASVEPAFAFLWLAALPIPLYWTRQRVALWFGAASHLVVERVTAAGALRLDDLARDLGLDARALSTLLARQPELPLVVDHEQRLVLSAAAAAQRRDLAVCPSCGGATGTGGQDRVACRYCHRSYAESRAAKPRRPVPFLVEALARLPETGAWVAALWGALLLVAFVVIEAAEPEGSVAEGLGLGAVVAGALGALAWALRRAAAALRAGRGYRPLRAVLVALAPLGVPLVALRRLRSRRVQLHFGRLDEARLADEVERRGELSFAELAAWLGCDLDDALETARYVAANDRIPVVYDRVGQRLVHRQVWAALAAEGACAACGGELGVSGGAVVCQHCGARPPAAA
jgi:hypothetical protein